MRKITKELLKSDSYVSALKLAIVSWEMAKTMKDKREYILAIGEIGNIIHKQNKSLDIKNMEVND